MANGIDGLIVWIKPLGRVSKAQLQTTPPISNKTTITSVFGTYPKVDSDFKAQIVVESTSTLQGSVTIDPGSVIEGNVSVYPVADDGVGARIQVSISNNLQARIEMALTNVVEGDVEIYGKSESTLGASIVVSKTESLLSKIKITPMNRMRGLVNLTPLPRVTVVKVPNKDSFIRSDVPRINYGNVATMQLGKGDSLEEVGTVADYRSLLEFDLDSLPNGAIVEKAKLVLRTAGYVPTTDITIEQNLAKWQEDTVAWVNRPLTKYSNKVSILGGGDTLTIDVLDIVKRWVEKESKEDNFGLTLSVDTLGEVMTAMAKEYGVYDYIPKLEVTYYDRDVAISVGETNLNATIQVAKDMTSNLRSRLQIKSQYDTENMLASITVDNPSDLGSFIIVNQPEISGRIRVKRSEENPLPVKLSIKGGGESLLGSTILVSRESLVSSITVAESSILPSRIYVQGHEHVGGTMLVSQEHLVTRLTVAHKDDMAATVTVSRRTQETLPATVDVHTVKRFNATITVAEHTTLNSTIKVAGEMVSLMDSAITVEKLIGEDITHIPADKDKARRMRATIDVRYESVVPAEIQVTNTTVSVMNSTIIVEGTASNDLKATMEVKYESNLHSHIKVISPLLPSTISVPGGGDSKLESTIQVAAFMVKDMVAHLDLTNPRDIFATITVVRDDEGDDRYQAFIM